MTEIPRAFTEGRCASCKWWSLNIGVETPGIDETKLPDLLRRYGKCNAVYTGNDGKEYQYDDGSLGATKCFAVDDNGKKLWEEVPKGR